ncbi:hypothetical protein ABW21_db0208896 [Orbilia brochopaga]|nr:hypothetical protein ABW21_db0208896 [Drechslerella brochopaga]
MYFKLPAAIVVLALTPEIASHGIFMNFIGNANGNIKCPGLGYDPKLPRTGVAQLPFQGDAVVLKNPIVPPTKWSRCWKPKGPNSRAYWVNHCGANINLQNEYYAANPTLKWGKKTFNYKKANPKDKNFWLYQCPAKKLIDWKGLTTQRAKEGKIIQVTRGGWIRLMHYQVNADGGGPFKCKISRSGEPMNWDKKWIIPGPKNQVPGAKKTSLNPKGARKPFPLTIPIPKDLECNGSYGSGNRVNYAVNGPFGGCIPFQLVTPGAPAPAPPKKNGKQVKVDETTVTKTVVVVLKRPPPPDEEDLNPGEDADPAPPPSDEDQDEEPGNPEDAEYDEEDQSPASY